VLQGCAEWAWSVNAFYGHLYLNSVDGGTECRSFVDFGHFVDFVIQLTWPGTAIIVNQGERHANPGEFIHSPILCHGVEGVLMSSTLGEPAPATPLLGAVGLGVLLEAMPDPLVGVDRAGVICLVNRQAEALFGYDHDALVGQLVEILVPESFRLVHQAQREGYLADPRTRSLGTEPQFFGVRRDGAEFPVDMSLSHVQTGGVCW
jgi:PAS domain S-box-containing protein